MKILDCNGIYIIFNNQTEDYYIGSTSKTFKRRLSQHISDLKKQKHRNIHLQRAFNKYGWISFTFAIIEVVQDQSNIIPREQYYLDTLKPHYNIAIIAECSSKGRKQTPEQIERLRQINIGRPAWNRGLRFSEESRKKMSESKKGKSFKRGVSTKSKNPVKRSDGKLYDNPSLAALELGVKANTIIKAISDKKIKRTVKGYYFEYIDYVDPLKYIVKCKRGYTVRVKDTYLGYVGTIDEAISLRDSYLKSLDKSESEELE